MKIFQTRTKKLLPNENPFRAAALSIAGFLAILVVIMISADNSINVRAQVSQKTLSGEWTAKLYPNKKDEIHFTFQRRSEKGGFNMTGDNLPLGQLHGLPTEALSSARTDVSFNIVREAGTFVCEGFFSEGKGAGFWTLKPNERFISQMRARGYDNLTEENLLSAALHDLTGKFIDDLKTAGYDKLTFEQLRRAKTHDITLQYVRELKSAGFENLTMEQMIRARNHDIDADYVNRAKAMGFERQPLETLIRMRNHDITAEFVDQMKTVGFENLSIEQLIRLKNHDITSAFIRELNEEGYANVSAESAIRLKNHDVDREFIRRAKSQGYNNVSLEELIRLRNRGVVK